jgi:branched-chain amino acid transport system permease protein
MAGGLLIPKVLVLSPDLFGVGYSGAGLLAVVLGGKASLFGPVFGGLAFGILPEALRSIDEYRLAIFAILLLIVVRVRPEGLASLIPKRKHKTAPINAAGTSLAEAKAAAPVVAQLRPLSASSGKTALEALHLDKRFMGLVAVDDVSVHVQQGELLGIIGPNGAGKTTMMSMLSGFLAPTRGEVLLNGERITGVPPHRIAARGLVRTFQQTAHCASLTVYENVLFASYLRHRETPWAGLIQTAAYRHRERDRQEHALRCLKEVGLDNRVDAIAGAMSYGEQKLLGLAIALAADPTVLLLDEPAAGLNQTEGNRLAEVLRCLKGRGCTIAVIDHNLPLMMSMCDRIAVLHHGQKIAEGEPKMITEHPEVIRAYLGSSVEETAA